MLKLWPFSSEIFHKPPGIHTQDAVSGFRTSDV